jgi:hypothetical protein
MRIDPELKAAVERPTVKSAVGGKFAFYWFDQVVGTVTINRLSRLLRVVASTSQITIEESGRELGS